MSDDKGFVSTWKMRLVDGAFDVGILVVYPFTRLIFRIGEKVKEKGWV